MILTEPTPNRHHEKAEVLLYDLNHSDCNGLWLIHVHIADACYFLLEMGPKFAKNVVATAMYFAATTHSPI